MSREFRGRGNMPPRGPRRGGYGYPYSRRPLFAERESPNHNVGVRGGFRGRGNQSQRPHRPILAHKEWQDWYEVSVLVSSLPANTTTGDLWQILHQFGNINHMDMFDDREHAELKAARVTFCPPPKEDFWHLERNYWDGTQMRKLQSKLMTERAGRKFETPKGQEFPEKMSMDGVSLEFGLMHREDEYMIMREIQDDVSLTLDLRRREIVVFFTVRFPTQNEKVQVAPQRYKFKIPISHLQRLWEMPAPAGSRYLIFPDQLVPEFYSKREVDGTFDDTSQWSEWRTWWRQTDIVFDNKVLQTAPVTLNKAEKPIVDIGRWTTYRLRFDVSSSYQYNQILQAIRDHSITISTPQLQDIPWQEVQVWKWLDGPENAMSDRYLLMNLSNETPFLNFPVRYQLEVCISQGIINEQNITQRFIQKLAEIGERDACAKLEHAAEAKKRFFDPERILSLPAPKRRRKPNSKWTYTRLVTITPSRIILGSPALEISNRVVRAYSQQAEHFIRVRFTDENEGKVYAKDDNTWDPVFNRIKRSLENGIKIGDRHFQFLASGNSQFREGGAFFFAPASGLSPDSIREWMGYLEDEKTPAKVAARLGQCFSTTLAVQGVTPNIIERADVKRNGFTFTDGCGKISTLFAHRITHLFNITQLGTACPSLYQFRMGGCKGVLAISPELKGLDVHIRRSQYKFAATTNGLEIIRWSAPGEAALNRQVISILHCLKVPDQIFAQRQTENLRSLEAAMENKENAISLLLKQVDSQQSTPIIANLLQDFMESNEPFVMSLLHLWRAWKVKKMKEKAAITIEKGTFVFGTTDESQTLRGHFDDAARTAVPEIFIQVTDLNARGKKRVVQGLCIVARNPSLHPGDIRVVRAVDNRRLRHLVDVVVFPQTGDQDIPSMCSGGDLDGDEFLVIWDEKLIPPRDEWNHPPMDFVPKQNPKIDRAVTKADLIMNFVNHMKRNNLARIAITHLASTDYYDEAGGAKYSKCVELAGLHSIAVDFPKTGQPAIFPRHLKVPKKPHFMVPKNRRPDDRVKYYHSKTILGRLYDSVAEIDFEPLLHFKFDQRILTRYRFEPGDLRLQAASYIKMEYDYDIRRIMNKHSIETEFEIWTAFVLNHGGQSNDYRISEEIGYLMMGLRDKFEELCYNEAGGKDFNKAGPFAAAMYTVTADGVSQQLNNLREHSGQSKIIDIESDEDLEDETETWSWLPRMTKEERPLISFPWILSKELIQIARMGSEHAEDNENKTTSEEPETLEVTAGSSSLQTADHKPIGKLSNHPPQTTVQTSRGLVSTGDTLELFDDGQDGNEQGGATARPVQNPAPSQTQQDDTTTVIENTVGSDSTINGHAHVETQTLIDLSPEVGVEKDTLGYAEPNYEQNIEIEIESSDEDDPLTQLDAAVKAVENMRLNSKSEG